MSSLQRTISRTIAVKGLNKHQKSLMRLNKIHQKYSVKRHKRVKR